MKTYENVSFLPFGPHINTHPPDTQPHTISMKMYEKGCDRVFESHGMFVSHTPTPEPPQTSLTQVAGVWVFDVFDSW